MLVYARFSTLSSHLVLAEESNCATFSCGQWHVPRTLPKLFVSTSLEHDLPMLPDMAQVYRGVSPAQPSPFALFNFLLCVRKAFVALLSFLILAQPACPTFLTYSTIPPSLSPTQPNISPSVRSSGKLHIFTFPVSNTTPSSSPPKALNEQFLSSLRP